MSDAASPPPAVTGLRPDQLTDAERAEIIELLKKKLGPTRTCEMCSNAAWGVGANLLTPVILSLNRETGMLTSVDGHVVACAQLSCTTCGNTKLFSVAQLGFRPDLFAQDDNAK